MFEVIVGVSAILTPIAVVGVVLAPAAWRRWRNSRYSDLERDVLSFLAQGHQLQNVSPDSDNDEDMISKIHYRLAVTLTVDAAIHGLIAKGFLLRGPSSTRGALYSCSLSEKGRKYMSENKLRLRSRGYKKLKVELSE